MSTVRVYKVAELLNTTSQEVLALLKKAHGIELKSASSTLEEIVARQFVDRLSKQRNITLPKGDIFSEQAVKPAKSKAAPGKKGQNVRLAAKLTGWRIDIKSEEEKRKEVEAQFGALEAAGTDGADDAPVEEAAAETTPVAEPEESK